MKITLNPNAKDAATRDALVAEGGFGKYYTDHMVMCEWSEKDGWGEPHLMPYGPMTRQQRFSTTDKRFSRA